MSTHMVFPKIHWLGKEECEWLLDWECIIQEKIDWANLSIWKEDNITFVWSRTQIVWDGERKEGFRGAVEYCNFHKGIQRLLEDNPTYRLFGEWLVKHTINYPVEYMNKFYMFDIWNNGSFIDPMEVKRLAEEYWIESPKVFEVVNSPSLDKIKQWAGKSVLGNTTGEWVVVKNMKHINKYGNFNYWKYVCEEFKEQNYLVFGSVQSDDIEMKFVTEFVSIPRLMKIVNKIEQNSGEKIWKTNTPQVMGMMWNDIFTEELWAFSKRWWHIPFNFNRASDLCNKRTRVLFFDLLDNNI